MPVDMEQGHDSLITFVFVKMKVLCRIKAEKCIRKQKNEGNMGKRRRFLSKKIDESHDVTCVSLWITMWKLGISRFFAIHRQKIIHFFSNLKMKGKRLQFKKILVWSMKNESELTELLRKCHKH